MQHSIGCINQENGCNDRGCLGASQDNSKQSRNSMNFRKNNDELNVNFPEPQSIVFSGENKDNQNYDMNSIREVIEILNCDTTRLSKLDDSSEVERFELASQCLRKGLPNVPDSLIPIVVGGLLYPSNSDGNMVEIPPWLDRAKFARGQRFACDHLFGVFFAEVLSLFTLFSFEDGLKPLIVTGKSAEPYTAFTRYLSTANRVRNWYRSDPWTKGTAAYNDINVVRIKHQNVRDKLDQLTLEKIDEVATIVNPWASSRDVLVQDFRSSCPVARPGQCPHALDEIRNIKMGSLDQGSMAATQFGFFGLVILFPEAFGIHTATDEDLESFCHVWKGIGYLLGIKDEFNFCRGTLAQIKQRARDFLEFWVKPNLRNITPEWEHMMRCVTAGLQYYFPGGPYEGSLLFLTELLGLEMSRFQLSLNFSIKLRHNLTKLILKYPYRVTNIRNLLNRRLHESMDRALKFDEEKHVQLREKSLKTMSKVLKHEVDNSIEIDDVHKSPISVVKYSQYKIIGILMVITQCLILWRII